VVNVSLEVWILNPSRRIEEAERDRGVWRERRLI